MKCMPMTRSGRGSLPSESSDRNGGRIRGEDRSIVDDAIQLAEYLRLQRETLAHGLDHQLRIPHCCDATGRGDATQNRRLFVARQFALANEPRETSVDRGFCSARELRRGVAQRNQALCLGQNFSDSPAHLSCANDPNTLHLGEIHRAWIAKPDAARKASQTRGNSVPFLLVVGVFAGRDRVWWAAPRLRVRLNTGKLATRTTSLETGAPRGVHSCDPSELEVPRGVARTGRSQR